MLDQLTNLVKQNADDAIINNPAIPNEKNEEVINEASNSIAAGLQNMLSAGNVQDILKSSPPTRILQAVPLPIIFQVALFKT